jgi:hypothetical protein
MSRKYYSNTPFLDLLFNALIGFVMLFFLAFMLIQPKAKTGDIVTKAEFVITVTWEDNSEDDVDTWLQDPLGNILYFGQRDIGMAHLDRDDLGALHDVVMLQDGRTVEYPYNQELTTIRGFIEGEWTLNLHMYNKRDPNPTEVMVRIDKLNPTVQTLFLETFVMERRWEEITVARFTMTEQGETIDWNNLPKSLVESHSSQPSVAGNRR